MLFLELQNGGMVKVISRQILPVKIKNYSSSKIPSTPTGDSTQLLNVIWKIQKYNELTDFSWPKYSYKKSITGGKKTIRYVV